MCNKDPYKSTTGALGGLKQVFKAIEEGTEFRTAYFYKRSALPPTIEHDSTPTMAVWATFTRALKNMLGAQVHPNQ